MLRNQKGGEALREMVRGWGISLTREDPTGKKNKVSYQEEDASRVNLIYAGASSVPGVPN